MSTTEVVVHPLVLLSVTDHYHRVAKDTRKRVVGVLLGSRTPQGKVEKVDITLPVRNKSFLENLLSLLANKGLNSFAVPFEEDLNNPKVRFVDHNFLRKNLS
jgi:26S proteasome regulatory subunit N8